MTGTSGALAGVGIHLVEVRRFAAAVDRFGARLLDRVFTADEIAYAARKRHGAQNLSARFAATCAGRAMLAASGRRVHLADLEVVRRRSGEPSLVLRREPEADLRLRVSLTHDADFAIASVWLEQGISA